MRTVAWETGSWLTLRTCSKEVGGEVSIYEILVKGAHAFKHTSKLKVAASDKETVSLLMILVLFWI